MKTTFGDLMGEYEHSRDAVKRFGTWDKLDAFVENLIGQLATKPTSVSTDNQPQQQFGFDDMGSVVPVTHD